MLPGLHHILADYPTAPRHAHRTHLANCTSRSTALLMYRLLKCYASLLRQGESVGFTKEKFAEVEKKPDWDGGSKGKVKQKGKRGPGFV